MRNVREAYASVQKEYFEAHGWSLETCPKCNSVYFSKRTLNTCGSYECENDYTFLKLGARRKFFELEECYKNFIDFFRLTGYEVERPIDIVRKGERTLFASVAGQVFDDAIYKGEPVSSPSVVCAQPVIRLQSHSLVGKVEGYSTSFLNISTDIWNSTPNQHFETLDRWLDFLSTQGLYVGNISLKPNYEDNDWGAFHVHSETVRLNYGGLELGIANFFIDIPQPNGRIATMSDISFGLERLVWGINKSQSYFDAIGPLIYTLYNPDKITLMDSIRTMTLMAASGVTPAHYDHGGKFRLLAKKIAKSFGLAPYKELSEYYYNQWSKFINLKYDSNVCENMIMREIERNLNVELAQALGYKWVSNNASEDYLHSLLKERKITLSQLREKIRKMKGEGIV
ncbi:MAG: hypothetical protein QXS74_09855 [Nitrososphaeria archaeon]